MASSADTEAVINVRLNTRHLDEYFIDGRHVSVNDLRNLLEVSPGNPPILNYLGSETPEYPSPVEFHVSDVSHVTDAVPFKQILESEGFNPPGSKLSWWYLNIKEEEIRSAEKRYLQNIFQNQTQEQIENHEQFLNRFNLSPAFLSESRYGNYRFTFPLAELMKMYQEQHCEGEEPVLRVMKTMFYKQEIVYVVLIHSPQHGEKVQGEFKNLPSLENSEFVRYEDGDIIWHAQAISDYLTLKLSVNKEEGRVEVVPSNSSLKYYVWDHVCLAFYLPGPEKALKVPKEELMGAVEACKLAKKDLSKSRNTPTLTKEERFEKAKEEIEKLKGERGQD